MQKTTERIRNELPGRGGLRSRFGQHRADLMHQPLDLLVTTAPWLLTGFLIYKLGRAVADGGRG